MYKKISLRYFLALVFLFVLLGSLIPAVSILSSKQTAHADSPYSYGDPSVTNGGLREVVSLLNEEAYAVGWENGVNGSGLVEHYSSGQWQKIAIPANTPPLESISALSSTDLWIAGGNGTPFLMHGNPNHWDVIPNPADMDTCGHGDFKKVLAFSPTNVYAVGKGCGYTSVFTHYDGTSLSLIPFSVPGVIRNLTGTEKNLVAEVDTENVSNLAQNLNGSWQVLTRPSGPANSYSISDGALLADGTILATGVISTASNTFPLIANWNGLDWSQVDTSSHPGVSLGKLTQNGNEVIAIGTLTVQDNNGGHIYTPVGYDFDGKTWSLFTLPKDSNPVDAPASASINSDGTVWIVGTSYSNDSTTGAPIIWRYQLPPKSAPIRHKLFVFVQGIGTKLSDYSFSNTEAYLKDHGYANADYLYYSYHGSYDTGLPQDYTCDETFKNAIEDDIRLLAEQIDVYVSRHQITDVYVIGHSLGGVIAFGYMAAAVEHLKGVYHLPAGANLRGLITLDSPLGGVISDPGYLRATLFRVYYLCATMYGSESVAELQALYNSASNHRAQGSTASVAGILGSGLTNQEVAMLASKQGLKLLTVGNTNDLLWRPKVCGVGQNFPSTQWVDVGRKLAITAGADNPLECFLPLILIDGLNHGKVLESSTVEHAIAKLVD